MSKPMTKQALVRSEWLTRLRREGDRQCVGFASRSRKHVCAMALLYEVTGDMEKVKYNSGLGLWDKKGIGYEKVGEKAGLNWEQTAEIIFSNDRGDSFEKIADTVEEWFR